MKRTLCIMMAGLFALVFSFGEMPLYSCVKKNSIHAMKSCCDAPPKVELKKSCCGEVKKVVVPTGPSLEAVCCNTLENHLDMPFFSESEIKSVDKDLLKIDYYTSFSVAVFEKSLIEKAQSQRGPPDRALSLRGLTSPLFKLHASYLI